MIRHKRIFISGGAGVIGQQLCAKLLAQGASLLVGDLKPCPTAWTGHLEYRQGDLNSLTRAELEAFAPDLFIHLAATFERSAESWEFWSENYRNNIQLSHHLMTLMRDLPSLRRVIFASSYLIYEPDLYQFVTPAQNPIKLHESMPIRPRNLIGMAKLAHEMELRYLAGFEQLRFDSCCVRIFRGYGIGSRDVISRWVRALLQDQTLDVYQPEGCFDYIYCKDSAEGLIRLADVAALPGVVNLGTGRSRRVADVLDVLGGHFPRMRTTTQASNLLFEASEADMAGYSALAGWTPVYDLEQAIPEIIAYERQSLDSARAR